MPCLGKAALDQFGQRLDHFRAANCDSSLAGVRVDHREDPLIHVLAAIADGVQNLQADVLPPRHAPPPTNQTTSISAPSSTTAALQSVCARCSGSVRPRLWPDRCPGAPAVRLRETPEERAAARHSEQLVLFLFQRFASRRLTPGFEDHYIQKLSQTTEPNILPPGGGARRPTKCPLHTPKSTSLSWFRW